MTATITANRVGPGAYHLDADLIETGTTFTHGSDTFLIVGEPISVGWNTATALVREVGGTHDGNEFPAHLYARQRYTR